MAVAERTTEHQVAIDGEAFSLLRCFYNGVDVFVRQKAVEIALDDSSFDEDGVTVLVRKDHVKKAGDEACEALQRLLKRGLPDSDREALEGMQGCFKSSSK